MKALAWLLWVLAALEVVAALGAFLAACWAHGGDSSRWAGTGFVLLVAAFVAGASGVVADEKARGIRS